MANDRRLFAWTLLLVACSRAPSRPAGTERAGPAASASAPSPSTIALSPRDRRKLALEGSRAPGPDLATVAMPTLTAALVDPDRLWRLLIAPETPYLERRAAGVQGRAVFPLARLALLTAALAELRREESKHAWGLEPHPMSARPSFSRGAVVPGAARTATVLGQPWTEPERRAEYPLTWEEENAAPWPWQVQQTLQQLFGALLPHAPAEAHAWLDACLALPWGTDEEASMFVEASRSSTHFKTPRVMARWRAIALSPKLPGAAALVAGEVGQATRLWDAPSSQAIGHAVTVDILTRSPHSAARDQAAYGLRHLTTRVSGGKEVPLSPPVTGILTALRLALDPRRGEVWNRLYTYGFSALEAMTAPPFAPDRRMDPNGPLPAARLADLERWLRTHRARLEIEAAREAPALQAARAALVAAEREEAAGGRP